MSGTASAFGVPAFRRLWIAGLVSDAGDWLLFVALPLLVLRLTGSAIGTAIAFLLEIAPTVLLGPLAGRLVDRLPRRTLLVVVTLAQAAAITPLLLVRTANELPIVFVVIVAQSALAAVFEPAKSALLPTLVGQDRIVSANALVGLNDDLGRLLGGPLGGLLFGLAGLPVVVLADLVTYLVAAGLLLALPRTAAPVPPTIRDGRREHRRPSRGPLAVLRRSAVRGPVLLILVAGVAQGMFVVLFVFFVLDVIKGSEADVGLLRGLQAVGAIAAGLVLGSGRIRPRVTTLIRVGTGCFALLTVAMWNASFLTHATAVYVLLFAAVGAPAVLMSAGLSSRLQAAATDADRGMVFAVAGIAQAAGQGIGLLVAGSLQSGVGTLPMLEVQAGLYVLAAALSFVLLEPSAGRAPLVEERGHPALEEAEEGGHLGEARSPG